MDYTMRSLASGKFSSTVNNWMEKERGKPEESEALSFFL